MRLMLRLAYRNLWRSKSRSLLTMSAMGIATALLILLLGFMTGISEDAVRSATGLYVGDAKVTAPGYLDTHAQELTLPEGERPTVDDPTQVRGIAGRVHGYALLTVGQGEESQSQPAELLGVVPADERAVSALASKVVRGQNLTGPTGPAMLLGANLARRLKAQVGDEVVAMGQAADGSIASGLFRVTGVLETGDPGLDATLAMVGRQTLQDMLVLPGQVHEWTVSLRDPMAARVWAEAASASAAARQQAVEVNGWPQLLPALAQIFDVMGTQELVTGFLFYFSVVLLVINTLNMALRERARELAVMGALGLRRRALFQLMVLEGAIMSAIAGSLGGALGLGLSLWCQRFPLDFSRQLSTIDGGSYSLAPIFHTTPTLHNVLWPTLVMVALGGLIASFPARRLSRRSPVEGLREV